MLQKYASATDELLFVEHQRAAAYGIYAMFYNGLTEAIKAVALGAGGILVARGSIGAEQLTASMLYVDSVVGSSLAVGGQYRQLMQSIGSSQRVFQYTEMSPSASVVNENSGGPSGRRITAGDFCGGIHFQNVSFAYPGRPDTPVLRGLDLDLPAGSTTALVGSSGSGKSTVAALVQRWYEPDAGDVLLDGVPLRDLDPVWLRSLLGVVTQDPRLFSTTVWENLVLGLNDGNGTQLEAGDHDGVAGMENEVLMQLVREAAEAAHAHEFIEQLPQGYATKVADARLSGGQKQRLALARALARRPRILLLDEATSALDRETEAAVQASITAYLRRTSSTCIVIAHRLSTIVDADRIVVLDQGRVAEEGTHKELLRHQGLYSRLVKGGL